jgi:hypothetical protein
VIEKMGARSVAHLVKMHLALARFTLLSPAPRRSLHFANCGRHPRPNFPLLPIGIPGYAHRRLTVIIPAWIRAE